MTTLRAAGTLLTASTDDRTLSYRLLPFGEMGATSLGRITVGPGVVTVPDDVATLTANMEHEPMRPIARFVSVDEDAAGLTATLRVLRTSAGDDLLVEAAEGVRTGISVELDDPVIRQGRLLAGRLAGAGVCVRPAFASALLVASDTGKLRADYSSESETTSTDTYTDPETGEEVTVVTTRRAVESSTTTDDTTTDDGEDQTDDAETDPEQDDTGDEPEDEEETVTASAPAAKAPLKAAPAGGGKKPLTASAAFGIIKRAYDEQNPQLLAALADVVLGTPANGIGARTNQPAWLGELWSGRAFQRKFVPLTNRGNLTAMKVAGWRWTTKPVMADYAGDKAAVPSNAVAVEPADAVAKRLAGGWDVDRAFFDFGDAGFIESFFRALTESYARLSDGKAGLSLVDAATLNPTERGAVPADVAPGMVSIVDGALAILDEGLPAYAIVANDLYRQVLLTRNDDTLAYLNASLGLEDGTVASFRVVPGGALLEPGEVVVGAREAVTFYELGETPIRVEAENIANGGKDVAVFGYWASIVNDSKAITLVTPAGA